MTILYQAKEEYSSGEPGYRDLDVVTSNWHNTKLACKQDCAAQINNDPTARCGAYVSDDKFYTWSTKNE